MQSRQVYRHLGTRPSISNAEFTVTNSELEFSTYCTITNISSPMRDRDMPDELFISSVPSVTRDMTNISSGQTECNPDHTFCVTWFSLLI
jgi:hypothetical protein